MGQSLQSGKTYGATGQTMWSFRSDRYRRPVKSGLVEPE